MPDVYISYRRRDAAHARRLFDELAPRYGDDHVFIDIDSLPPAASWTDLVRQLVGSCDATLVLVGPAAGDGSSPPFDDGMRVEIAAALASDSARVIPVLVGGAKMPAATDLPEDVRELAHRQALELRPERWAQDVERLLQALDTAESPPAGPDGIFICYRREDSRWPAGRLADALRERFGEDRVFMDSDRIRVGNWREQIDEALDASAAVIVLIGPHWADELERRSEGQDEVRYEIAEALRRGAILLPVTLGRAEVPDRSALPPDIAALVDHEVYELGEDRLWRPTVKILFGDLEAALEDRDRPQPGL